MKSFILALDQGTTSSRSIVFDGEGSVVASAQKEFEQIFPQPGWVEHDAEAIWHTQLTTAREAISAAGLTASDIAAIGVTNQRETVVVWDRQTKRPICNAIVWQDRRTATQTDTLKTPVTAELIRTRTGLLPDPYFSASKVRWVLENVDGARAAADAGRLAFGTIDSWLVYCLTEGRVHCTDVSNASRTMLFNIHTAAWDDELLALFDIPHEMLPDVVDSSGEIGQTTAALLGAEIPIAGIAGDQQAALFGQLCLDPGMSKNTYGTGCFMLMQTGEEPVASTSNLLTTVAWRLAGQPMQYALEGSVFMGGAAIQWLRDGLGIIKNAAAVNALAASVADSGGVVVVPAFSGLGAPHWDPRACGTIQGLTRGSTAAHIARATLEGISFQVADVFDAMERDMGGALSGLRVDGGAAASDLLMQLQADILGIAVERPKVTESTALGAAYLAGMAVGVWPDLNALSSKWQLERRFEPTTAPDARRQHRAQWSRAVERSKAWVEE
ncbi:MAG: glycerol kinase GlpK [Verrucomicrobia bacterium]|jgi:glycerol kinase|nr:glycerol kinase GlpK [Verrucomicrobiota bacterium]